MQEMDFSALAEEVDTDATFWDDNNAQTPRTLR